MGHLNHSKLVNYLKATIEQTKDLTSTSGDWTINIWDTLCWFEVISGDLWPGFGHIAVAKARFLDEGRRNGKWSRQRPTVSSDFSVKSSAQGRIADTISAEIHFFFAKVNYSCLVQSESSLTMKPRTLTMVDPFLNPTLLLLTIVWIC